MQVQVRKRTVAEKGAGEGATSSASGGVEKKGSGGRRSRGRAFRFSRIGNIVHITNRINCCIRCHHFWVLTMGLPCSWLTTLPLSTTTNQHCYSQLLISLGTQGPSLTMSVMQSSLLLTIIKFFIIWKQKFCIETNEIRFFPLFSWKKNLLQLADTKDITILLIEMY